MLYTIFGVTLTLTSCLSHPRKIVLLIVAYYFEVTVTLTSDFGLLKMCGEHISYTTWHRNPILGLHFGVVECCILY